MYRLAVCCLLLDFVSNAMTETMCKTSDGKKLEFTFQENINSTQADFSFYFYPHSNVEEKLIDCAWVDHQLYCIGQEGFECKQPVTHIVVISVPMRFVNREGKYSLSTFGYQAIECRLPQRQDFTSCEVTPRDGSQVSLNCSFSFSVNSFIVQQNNNTIASFKKSDCEGFVECHRAPGENYESFRVRLNKTGDSYDEYICRPDIHLPLLQVKACSIIMDKQTESASVISIAVALVIAVIFATGVLFLLIKRRKFIMRKKITNVEEPESETLNGG